MGKPATNWGIVHCHVWLPEVIYSYLLTPSWQKRDLWARKGIWGQGAGMEDDAQADCCVHTDLGVPFSILEHKNPRIFKMMWIDLIIFQKYGNRFQYGISNDLRHSHSFDSRHNDPTPEKQTERPIPSMRISRISWISASCQTWFTTKLINLCCIYHALSIYLHVAYRNHAFTNVCPSPKS